MNILQDILGLFKRDKFTTPKNKDVIYVARNQKQSHLVEPKLDSKVMELKSLKDWVLSGVDVTESTEPFKRDVALYPLQITRGFGPRAMQSRYISYTLDSSSLNYAQPFWVHQKVNVTRYMISLSAMGPNIGKFVIYKFDSEVNPYVPSTDLNFSLVYEETVQSLTGPGTNQDFLSSTVTLVPGEVYIAMFVPDTSFPVECIEQQYNLNQSLSNVWDTNKFLGDNGNMNGRMTGLTVSIQLGASPTYAAPATIVANCHEGNATSYEYLQIGLKNA